MITPLEIEQRQFEKSFRGYDIEEVGRYLANLAQEWERMTNESKMLKMQIEVAEKEASNLREVERTLIKTLRTAEDTSSRIAENAKNEAEKTVADAQLKANQILKDAEFSAKTTVEDAEQKASSIRETAKNEFSAIESKFSNIEAEKQKIISQLKSIIADTNIVIANADASLAAEISNKKTTLDEPKIQKAEETKAIQNVEVNNYAEEIPATQPEEEEEVVGMSFGSAANDIKIETDSSKTNLEIIEGIGPKIKEVLNSDGIVTFRDLATTPIHKIKDILEAAGPHFSAHDPSTWVEQALLAEAGEMEKLERLKEYLVAGRAPKAKSSPERSNSESGNTEEMLDKVNKVKAAIRKSMMEKEEPEKPYVNQGSGSFFDSIN